MVAHSHNLTYSWCHLLHIQPLVTTKGQPSVFVLLHLDREVGELAITASCCQQRAGHKYSHSQCLTLTSLSYKPCVLHKNGGQKRLLYITTVRKYMYIHDLHISLPRTSCAGVARPSQAPPHLGLSQCLPQLDPIEFTLL